MAPKYHPTPLSGGDRKALKKELVKSRAMTHIPGEQGVAFKHEVTTEKADTTAGK
jgi:hypothetical protein